jgi:hypothetical protein
LLPAAGVVQVDQHRRILRHGVQHGAEVAERLAAQQHVLAIHQLGVADLLLAGGEVVVPEERHLLRERRGRADHLGQPPLAKLQALLHVQALLAHAIFGTERAVLVERQGRRVDESRRGLRGLAARSREHALDGLGAREAGEIADLGVGGAEADAVQEMAGALVADGLRGSAGGCHEEQERKKRASKDRSFRGAHGGHPTLYFLACAARAAASSSFESRPSLLVSIWSK